MTRYLIPTLVFALAACERPASDLAEMSIVRATDAVCRPTPQGRQVTGCYLTLTASRNDTLTAVDSPAGALAQIHASNMENNMMVMYELEGGLPLPAGEAVGLAPGGTHIMLLGVREPLVTGDTVPLNLTFANARPVEIAATVGQPASPGAVETDHGDH